MSTLNRQAKVTSPVAHVDTSGQLKWMVVGAVGGVAIGALTGGVGWLAFIGFAVTGAGYGANIAIVVDPNELEEAGRIKDGSPDTFIGADRQDAARASYADPKTLVDCHGDHYVIQGSETVFINRCGASRKLDGLSCGGLILDGDETVFTGGMPTTVFQIGEMPKDLNELWLARINFGLDLTGLLSRPTTWLGGAKYFFTTASLVEQAALGVDGDTGPITAANGVIGPVITVIEIATGSPLDADHVLTGIGVIQLIAEDDEEAGDEEVVQGPEDEGVVDEADDGSVDGEQDVIVVGEGDDNVGIVVDPAEDDPNGDVGVEP